MQFLEISDLKPIIFGAVTRYLKMRNCSVHSRRYPSTVVCLESVPTTGFVRNTIRQVRARVQIGTLLTRVSPKFIFAQTSLNYYLVILPLWSCDFVGSV